MEKEEGGKHQCEHCGKSYVFKHKLAHHKTWLCKEVAPTLVELEPRRKLSSNVFHLPTIPEREDGGEGDFASERVSKPRDQSEGSEGAGTSASERVSKPHDQSEGSEGAGTFASERVSKPHDQGEGDGAVALLCFKCQETFTSKNSFKKHMKRKHKGEQVIRFI